MTVQRINSKKQHGGVSLFVVIFAALLLSVVTVSFIQLMLSDQRQSADSDLSQSARDSAMAGVEDAKRVLLRRLECRETGTTTGTCARVIKAVDDNAEGRCNTVGYALDASVAITDMTERKVVTGAADDSLEQAYTCVVITPDTEDFVAPGVQADDAVIVPLTGVSRFDTVKLRWFTRADAGTATAKIPSFAPQLPTTSSGLWSTDTPALMRAQLMQTGSSFTLDSFDGDNAKTLFLYPSTVGAATIPFGLDGRRSGSSEPQRVICQTDLSVNTYSCEATLPLPDPVGGTAATRANAFLRLSPLYSAASIQVELYNGSNLVRFNGVQPSIDSTGRAGDIFRRVETRVEMTAEALYPRATVDVTGNLCKAFSVTENAADYEAGTCTP